VNTLIWILIAGGVGFLILRARGASASTMKALLERGAQKVDVRTAGEFGGGSAPGAINIPLDQLASRLGELDRAKPVLVCCASGSRSAMAASLLKAKGFEAVNAGPWTRLNAIG
jgi:rhodanese-related sulfurtransferase